MGVAALRARAGLEPGHAAELRIGVREEMLVLVVGEGGQLDARDQGKRAQDLRGKLVEEVAPFLR
ncbi:MAG: hypothetical protein WDO13_17640 [Verrucomicrobiota bacterium]